MKKYLATVLLMLSVLIPAAAFAQTQGDVDPNASLGQCVVVNNNLRFGSRDASTGGDVSALQDYLNTQGYLSSQPTGYFGSMTLAAVEKFQADNNLTNSGYVGPLTRMLIHTKTCNGTSPVSTPVSMSSGCFPGALYNNLTGALCQSVTSTSITSATSTQILNVYSPRSGDIWYEGNAYTIYWSPAQGDFDAYVALLGNHLVPGVLGGGPTYTQISKYATSTTFNPQDLSDNLIQTWVANSHGVSEQAIRQNFFYTIRAVKNSIAGKDGPVVAQGTSGTFTISPSQSMVSAPIVKLVNQETNQTSNGFFLTSYVQGDPQNSQVSHYNLQVVCTAGVFLGDKFNNNICGTALTNLGASYSPAQNYIILTTGVTNSASSTGSVTLTLTAYNSKNNVIGSDTETVTVNSNNPISVQTPTINLKTQTSPLGSNSLFLTASIGGDPLNKNVASWSLQISCPSGVSVTDKNDNNSCGTTLAHLGPFIYSQSSDIPVLTAPVINNSGSSAVVGLTLTAYDAQNDTLGSDKDSITVNGIQSTQTGSTTASIDQTSLKAVPNNSFIISGSASANSNGPFMVVVVGPNYNGTADWNTVGNLLKESSVYPFTVANTAYVSGGRWSAWFNGIPSDGSSEKYYTVFVYDSAHTMIGSGTLTLERSFG